MNIYQPVISGSLTVTGSTTFFGNITINSGSLTMTSGSLTGTASLASNALLLQGTGSVGFATTASLLEVSSSQQQISSSQQQISASLLNVVANYATTGSNSFRANQSITGSLVVSSTITAQTLVVQTVTSSIVYSSGSNLFGSALGDRQTFTGSVNITGSLTVNTTGTEFQVTNNGVVMGNLLTDNHRITGSLMLTGSLTVNSSSFYIGSNNQIGVNTLTPQSQFVVTKAGNNASLEFNLNNTGYSRIFSYDRGVATSTNLVLQDPGGSVGIGITNPSVTFNVGDANHGIGIAYRGSSALPTIAGLFTDTGGSGGSGYGDLLVKARTDYGGFYGINFYTAVSDNTPVLRMRIQSDGVLNLPYGQIQFPASQNASSNANTLDDYEEGTFTPALTIGGSSAGITYTTRNGAYTKIGRLVTIQLGVKMSSIGSNTGELGITGIPFAFISDSYYHPYGVVGVVLNATLLPLYSLGAASSIVFRKANTVSDVAPTNSDIDDDTYIFVTMTYSTS